MGTQAAGSTFVNGTPGTPGKIEMSQFVPATAPDGTNFALSTHVTSDKVTLGTIAATGTSDLNYHYTFGPAYNYLDPQSVLSIDTNVGASGAASDRLIVSGSATGKTAIMLWDTSTIPGKLNLTGITLAVVNGASSNAFYLYAQENPAHFGGPLYDEMEPGVGPMGAIKKGIFFFPLLQDTSANGAQGISVGGSRYALFGLPDIEAFQLPIAITASQSIFYETAAAWNDRQDELRNWIRRSTIRSANIPACDPRLTTKAPCISPPKGLDSGTIGPAVWAKAIGSWTNRNASENLGFIVPAASALSLDLGYRQNTFGIIGGIDVGHEGVFSRSGSDAIVVGLMGGYLNSNLNFKSSPTSFNFTGGSVGASASYINQRWFIDGLVKADFLNMTMNFPTLAPFGIGGQSSQANSFGGIANAGYRWDNAPWYLEPIITLTYVRTKIDSLSLGGITADFGDGGSARGAAGARAGVMAANSGQWEIDGSVTAKIWDQFWTQNGVTIQSDGTDLTLEDHYAKAFGEVVGQINVTNKFDGWAAFINTGVKFNSDFTTITAKGGARYQW